MSNVQERKKKKGERAASDYSKGKVYRLVCGNTGRQYIGSTVLTLNARLSKHKHDRKRYMAGKRPSSCTSFIILAEGNYRIEMIENFPCKTEQELVLREQQWIKQTANAVNKNMPGRSKSEWYQDNREVIREKKNRRNICQCGGKFVYSNKARHLNCQLHRRYLHNLNLILNRRCSSHRTPVHSRALSRRCSSVRPRLGRTSH